MNTIKHQGEEHLSFRDGMNHKHGLHGHVQVFRENKKTGERTLWYEDDNIIPISGYQYILMKIFDLYLDSSHHTSYEELTKDTTLEIPDLNLNDQLHIGIDPTNYSILNTNVPENHFIQGFMVGNGGSGEDAITTKNTDYSFMKLRNPIPFQQTQTSLTNELAGKYLGILRHGNNSYARSYYIKKFDDTPHIYHSWYRDGQSWDYLDPVVQDDLGPGAVNGVGKTNRIETYAECEMSLDNNDCTVYFSHDNSSPVVNELGLVAYDAVVGTKTMVEMLYQNKISRLITLCFDNNRAATAGAEVIAFAAQIVDVLSTLNISAYGQTNINAFIATMESIANYTSATVDFAALKTALGLAANIEVEAHYNQNGVLVSTQDKFLTYLNDAAFYPTSGSLQPLTTDEAQRIKLITYYTFNPIPLESDWRIIFNYRIYAN